MKNLALTVLFLLLGIGFLEAQVTASDCSQAINICTNGSFQVDPNGSGSVTEFTTGSVVSNPQSNPNNSSSGLPNSGCLLSGELNSTWMVINIATSGQLEFSMGDPSLSGFCFDWIMWPYDASTCNGIINNTLAPAQCNWNGACGGITGAASVANITAIGGSPTDFEVPLNVTCGDQYIICLSNYSSATTSVPLNFFGSATVSCTIFTPITVNDATICDGQCATLTAAGGNTYNWNPSPHLNTTSGATVSACPPGPGTYTYDVTGTGNCGSGTATSTVTVLPSTDPNCSTPCFMTGLNINVGACQPATYSFDITGTVSFTDPPTTGQLIVENCSGDQQVFNAPFASPTNFTISGISADGTTNCDVTAYFTADASCTITSNSFTEPTCPCNIDYFEANIGACDAITNTFDVTGYVDLTSPPTTGQMIVSDCNGNQQVFNAPFAGTINYSLTGILSDGQPCSVTVSFTSDPGCTNTINYTNPSSCICSADAGTYTSTLTGSGNTNYVLCENDIIDITYNNDGTPPDDQTANGISPYNPGIWFAIYSCPPTVSGNNDINTDPCLVGVFNTTGNGIMSDINDLTIINSFPAGTFTNNTVYYVPLTMYDIVNGIYSPVYNGQYCYDLGTPVAVTYLPPITSTMVEDCQAGSVTVTLNGGHPELFGTNFTASNLQPGTASFANTTAPNGGTITITGLQDGDMYSFDVSDQNGCPHTITGGPFVGPDDATITPAGPFCPGDPAFQMTAADPGGTWSGPGMNASGQFNPATAGVGTHTITYTIPGTCGDVDTEDVTVTALADATITPGGPYCETDGSVILMAATSGGTWSGTGITNTSTGEFDPATAGPGTHTITYTITGSCGNSDTEDFVVVAMPDAGTPGNISVCNSDPAVNLFNLIGGTPQAGGTWTGPSVLANGDQGTFDPATNTAGTYTYTVSGAPTCPDATTDVVVNITTQLDATITPVAPVCESAAAFNLSAVDPGGTYTGTGITNGSAGTFDPSVAGPGTHTITYTLGGSCGDVQTTDITVVGEPDAGSNGSVTYCDVDPSDDLFNHLTGTPQAGGTWTGPSALANGDQGTFNPSANTAGTYTYTVSGAPTCPDATAEVVVTVQNQPDVTISPAGPFCESNPSAALAAVTPGGTWSGTGITNSSTGIFDPATAGPGTHTITYTISGFCGNVDTEDIQVIADDDATVNPAGPFCTSDPAQVITAVNGGGVWSSNAPAGSINAATGSFDPSISGAGVWDVTYTISGACGDAQTIQVTVSNQLDASIDPAGPFCANDPSYVMQASVDAGGTWSASCVGCIDANTGSFNPSAAGVGQHTITYTHSGQCGDTQDILVDVLPVADASINPVNPLCIGNAPINLTSAQAGGIWSGLGITDPVAGTFDPNVSGSGSHTVTYTIGGQCGDAQSIQVLVNPPLSVTAFSDQDICDGADANISAIAQGGDGAYTYIWTDPIGNQVGVGQFITVSPLVTTTYTVTVSDNCGTTVASDQVTITIVPLPTVQFGVDNVDGCAPLTVTFTNNTNPQGTNCVWDFGDTYSSTDCGSATHTYTTAGCYDVTLTVTSGGCTNAATQTDMVCVYQPATAYFEYSPEVTNVYDPEFQFNNLSSDADSYTWSFGDGEGSLLINPNHTYLSPGTYEVCLTAHTDEGCDDTYCDSVTVEDVFIVYVPNAFTVDQDGLNEVFLPVVQGHIEESYELYIYDRWGQLIFESHHSEQGWDGTYRNQAALAKSDVYVWKLRVKSALNDEQKEFVGHVTLLK